LLVRVDDSGKVTELDIGKLIEEETGRAREVVC
jgi:hypothetical protein